MQKFYIEVFTSRNTTIQKEAQTLKGAHAIGRTATYPKYVISTVDGAFEVFENNNPIATEWSYPNGLGQIKANS